MNFAQKAIYTRGLYAKSKLVKVPLLKCLLVKDAQESNNERMELDDPSLDGPFDAIQ